MGSKESPSYPSENKIVVLSKVSPDSISSIQRSSKCKFAYYHYRIQIVTFFRRNYIKEGKWYHTGIEKGRSLDMSCNF